MVTLGSILGGFVPSLWGDSIFSYAAAITSTMGGIAGIWVGIKLGDLLGE